LLDDGHLWQAVKYVELNPVRAGMAERAEDCPWSSARAHCDPSAPAGPWGTTWNSRTGWVAASTPDPAERPCRDPLLSPTRPFPAPDVVGDWSAWLAAGVEEETVRRIRYATATGRPCGGPAFVSLFEGLLGRLLRPRKRGPKAKGQSGEGNDPCQLELDLTGVQ